MFSAVHAWVLCAHCIRLRKFMTLLLWVTLNTFVFCTVAHFKALLAEKFGILALFQVLIADSFSILALLQVLIAENLVFEHSFRRQSRTILVFLTNLGKIKSSMDWTYDLLHRFSLLYQLPQQLPNQFNFNTVYKKRRHNMGDMWQVTWDRRRETGDRRHESETGDMRQETWDRRREAGDRRR